MKSRFTDLWRRLGVLLCVVGLVGSVLGCEKSPQEKLRDAMSNLERQTKLEETRQLLNEVLKAKPDNLKAKRLLAQVYQMQGDYKRAEDKLTALWRAHNFGGEDAELSADLRSARGLIRDDFVDLYKTWAENLDPKTDKYIETVEKGLEYDSKDMDLNAMAVDYYWSKGQRLVDEGKKKKAARAFEQILALRTRRGNERRQKAKKKARDLRLEFFKDEGRKRFKSVGADTIAEIEGLTLSEDGETIKINVVQDINRRLNPDNDKEAGKAKQIAFIGLIDKLRKVTLTIAGLPKDADLSKIGSEEAKRILLSKLEFDETSFQRGRYTIKGTLPVERAIGIAYDIKTAYEEAKQKESAGQQGDREAADSEDASTTGGGDAGDSEKRGDDASDQGGEP